jgi:CRP-like cAMP-binding protein
MRAFIQAHPRIADALWRDTLIDAAVFREWIVGLGRRDALTRIAHLFCEMLVRLKSVGLAEGNACDLPMTQAEIGDALGLSTVHVNRILRSLRAAGLIELRAGTLTVKDWEGLQSAGVFDATYLHLKAPILRAA